MHTVSRGTPSDERLAGLLEALGSFEATRTGRNVNPHFCVRAPERDRGLLVALRAGLGGIGRIYEQGRGGWQWRVSRRDELLVLLDHFERHPLLGSKRAVLRIWRTLVHVKASRFRRPPRARIEALTRRLSRVRAARRSRRGRAGSSPAESGPGTTVDSASQDP